MSEQREQANDPPLEVVFRVPDHEGLLTVLDEISDADAPAQTQDITPVDAPADTPVTIDIGILTDKQREALRLAVDRGYYERPRDVTLNDLASHLNISKSAVSQRLRSAERKIVKSALCP